MNTFIYVGANPLIYNDPTGEFVNILIGVGIGAGLDLFSQLAVNGWNIDCVNWTQVGISGALGAVGGGWFSGVFKHAKSGLSWLKASRKWANVSSRVKKAQNLSRGTDLHHWAIPNKSKIPNVIKNHPANIKPLPKSVHKRIHGRDLQRGLPKYNVAQRWWYGTPDWAKAAEGSIAAGAVGEAIDNDECKCGN